MFDKLEIFSSNSGVGLVQFNPRERKWTKVNNQFVSLLGYPKEKLLTEEYTEFIYSEDSDKAEDWIKLKMNNLNQNEHTIIGRFVHGVTGKIITILWITDGAGYITDCDVSNVMAIDITDLFNLYSKSNLKKDSLLELFKILKDKEY